ncbi:MAG: phosphatase PAP2 family protein [Candidatus Methylomirabilis sp.]|nr:phosphatase PAP2 family protein [Deltaproteobacteria bacterium]
MSGRLPAAVGIALLFVSGYFGIPQLHRGEAGIDLTTPLDRAAPYVPAFAYAYLLGYVQVFLPAALIPDERLFRRGAAAMAVVLVVAFAVFALLPVRVAYPPLGDAPGEWILAKNRLFKDYGFNALPSLHVALSVLAALSIHHGRPALRGPIWLSTALIAASTVLVKRHYALDVPAGALLGWAVHRSIMTDAVIAWRRGRA